MQILVFVVLDSAQLLIHHVKQSLIYCVKHPSKSIPWIVIVLILAIGFIWKYYAVKVMMQLEECMTQEVAKIQDIAKYMDEMAEKLSEQGMELENAIKFQRNFPVVNIKQEIAELQSSLSQTLTTLYIELPMKLEELAQAYARFQKALNAYQKLESQKVKIEKLIQDFVKLQNTIEAIGDQLPKMGQEKT